MCGAVNNIDVFGLLQIPNPMGESHWTIYKHTFDNESYRIIPRKI